MCWHRISHLSSGMHYGKTNEDDKSGFLVSGNEITHKGTVGGILQGFLSFLNSVVWQWGVLFIKCDGSGAFWGNVVNI